MIKSEKYLTQIVNFLEEEKAQNVLIFDRRTRSILCDFVIICSVDSERHLNAIVQHTAFFLKQLFFSVRVEGAQGGNWVIVDIGDVIIHIFRQEIRTYYNLEQFFSSEMISRD